MVAVAGPAQRRGAEAESVRGARGRRWLAVAGRAHTGIPAKSPAMRVMAAGSDCNTGLNSDLTVTTKRRGETGRTCAEARAGRRGEAGVAAGVVTGSEFGPAGLRLDAGPHARHQELQQDQPAGRRRARGVSVRFT